uniref:Pyruvate decarboxylase n=1 Tax=[Candida] sonorensis TaxID=51926 RepID=S0BDX7_9ASCO|nr:pyruvate decarboxylase [[Candida] sonorensis]
MPETKRQKTLPSQITLGQYLFERLRQVNVKTVFGVPGDFNLALLDHIYEVDGLRWAGNANELNAAYSTDGYSRVNGFGAIVTTFGVGELSALNGIAGAYAEHVGLIHIVGTPSVSATQHKLLLHHTLGDSRFDVFKTISSAISAKLAAIDDINTAPALIDKLIQKGYTAKRPVYLAFPSNFVEEKVDSSLLNVPIDLNLYPNDVAAEEEIVEVVMEKIKESKNPVILVDACASRHDVRHLVERLANTTQYPVFTTPMGKSSFDEENPRFGGVYVGALSSPDVKATVESADLILSVGGLLSDFNTGSFSYEYHTNRVIEFHSDYCKVQKALYDNLHMKFVLERLDEELIKASLDYTPIPIPKSIQNYKQAESITTGDLHQEFLWKKLSYFLKSGDVIVTETGTSSFGIIQTHFPSNTIAISQVLWGSIGYSLPAATGATFALEEIDPSRKVILFIGDGSLQLTVQSISDLCRWNLKPYIFVLNNKGYTIEKLIHGPHAQYNQIQPWNHAKMLELFHGEAEYENIRVGKVEELNHLFDSAEFNKNDKIRVVELMLDEFDAPENLKAQAKISEKTNSA